MHTAAMGRTQKQHGEQGIDQQDIFPGVVVFLAALPLGRFKRVVGADAPSVRAVMGKRGATDTAAGPATTATEPPSRCARAVRAQAGAAPRARSAARSAGRRTCIHCLALL